MIRPASRREIWGAAYGDNVASDFDIRPYRRIVVLSGAGLSAAAGLGTFRGDSGLWTIAPHLERAMHADLLPDNLPDLWRVWGGTYRRALQAGPTPGHVALARMGVHVITQNVDSLHQAAGSTEVDELHGSAARAVCLNRCGWRADLPADPGGPIADRPVDYGLPDRCPDCGALIRPDVVLFGEALPEAAVEHALASLTTADLFLSVGTSGTVAPANQLAPLAKRAGAVTVNLDPHADANAIFDHVIRDDAQEVLPAWADLLR